MPRHSSYSCALVTGASSGLGEEFALQLAGRVDCLILVARREHKLRELAVLLAEVHPALEVIVFAADLADPAEREDLVAGLVLQDRVPDLLINNAGLGDYGEFASADWARIRAMLATNIDALTHLTHALLPAMIRSGRGAVLNVSSLACLMPLPDFAVYAATKAYVTSFSEALRIELKPHGIRVLAVCPGPVATGFGDAARRHGERREMPGYDCFYLPREQVVAESLAALATGRARVYPGLRTALAALALSALPLVVLRLALSFRPRRG